ncbi:unnamed protein product [Rotaria sordida]|uniref:Uncharacterized protein n=1 Tax=Rotaria sordida TaxID=392033 RepID=A0A814ETX9_9BILA|nr:unnamed protein product [Rotaria sordida]CAF0971920.1 unnamed protein product [Rotaria sordida]CAF1021617.1 unnamed protein product [Rotaria sordida]CAF1047311.1 unnamed protein product [Rotaria sordida]CAF1206168.1 unnamed protein product [Rotaria sordida]
MFHPRNVIDDDSDYDDETVNSNISDKIRSIIKYICNYIWSITFIFIIFIMYVSIRGPFNIINNFNAGKHFEMEIL